MNSSCPPATTSSNPEPLLRCETNDGILTLTLNRPDKYNALSTELLQALDCKLKQIKTDQANRVVIIAAAGKAFCPGHDLKQMDEYPDIDDQRALFTLCGSVMQRIVTLPQPVIAQVQGMATAAGCQLVASCDLAIASREARFAVSGIKIGLFCSTPAVALSRNISRKRAMHMLLTGDFIDADTALNYGLVNQVVEHETLNQVVDELAHKIAARPPQAIQLGKKLFNQQAMQALPEAYDLASEAMACNMQFDETREGLTAFIEKREPNWK